VLVTAIGGRVTWTLGVTSWVDFLDSGAIWVLGLVHVMTANWHGVRITSCGILKVSSSNNSVVFKPAPWGSNLSTIATHTETL